MPRCSGGVEMVGHWLLLALTIERITRPGLRAIVPQKCALAFVGEPMLKPSTRRGPRQRQGLLDAIIQALLEVALGHRHRIGHLGETSDRPLPGRRLGVSKQAAAKTVRSLEAAGYAHRQPDIADGRVVLLRRTDRGAEMLALSARFFEQHLEAWRALVGRERFNAMAEALAILGEGTSLGDVPGWLAT